MFNFTPQMSPLQMPDQTKDILILVKTYPEISAKYTETVCIAGILADSRRFVRLYPLPYRYLDENLRFKKYQWINTKISKAFSDPRPESHTVYPDTLETGELIGTKDEWNERIKWVLNPETQFTSVEELSIAQQKEGTSLGIVRPKRIIDFKIEAKSGEEKAQAERKKQSILSQSRLFDKPKDLELIPYRFMVKFKCDHPDCKTHKMGILDWEFGELYRKLRGNEKWEEKISNKFWEICSSDREPYLILGNLRLHPTKFCILGLIAPPRRRQLSLF